MKLKEHTAGAERIGALQPNPYLAAMAGPLHDDPLYGHPWQTPEAREAKRKERHRRWLAMLTARDWDRIRALEIAPGQMAAAVEDLDARGLKVGIVRAGDEQWCTGERIGTLQGGDLVVLVWEK